MSSPSYIYILCFLLFSNFLIAQEPIDSLKTITIKTYRSGQLKSLKLSQYDTSQILLQQDRWDYQKVDTGLWVKKHYHYDYKPSTKTGEFYTEYNKKDGSKIKKHLHKFRSFKHSSTDRSWVKLYDQQGKVLRYTQNTFDDNAYLLKVYSKDNSYQPALIHTEEVDRNDLGLMQKWISYDEDQDGKRKVREMNWTYKDDTILLNSSGYVFNDWKETVNNFDKKTGLIKKKIQTYGYRQDNGKIIRNHKNISTYKNGKKVKLVEYEHKKKFATHYFEYIDEHLIERIDYKEKGKADEVYKTTTLYDSTGRLSMIAKSFNDKPTESHSWIYREDGTLKQEVETEYRKNGSISILTIDYNNDGRIREKRLMVDARIIKKEEFEYEYYPKVLEKEEEGE